MTTSRATRAARVARELEEARAELAAQALALERLRIARELHDLVAHSMSMVAMHSGAARLAVGTDPEAESAALAVVERTTRDALAEMRRLVTVLREDPAPDPEGRSPAAGLGGLPRLVADMAAVALVWTCGSRAIWPRFRPGCHSPPSGPPAEASSRSVPEDSGDELTRRYIEAESLASCPVARWTLHAGSEPPDRGGPPFLTWPEDHARVGVPVR